MVEFFNIIVDGNDLTEGKAHPEVFLLAAGMRVMGVGPAASNLKADLTAQTLKDFDIIKILQLIS